MHVLASVSRKLSQRYVRESGIRYLPRQKNRLPQNIQEIHHEEVRFLIYNESVPVYLCGIYPNQEALERIVLRLGLEPSQQFRDFHNFRCDDWKKALVLTQGKKPVPLVERLICRLHFK